MLEALSGKKCPRYNNRPKFSIQKINNINTAIAFMEETLGVKVFGSNPQDIVQGNEKQIMGVLFLMMTRVRQERRRSNAGLEEARAAAAAATAAASNGNSQNAGEPEDKKEKKEKKVEESANAFTDKSDRQRRKGKSRGSTIGKKEGKETVGPSALPTLNVIALGEGDRGVECDSSKVRGEVSGAEGADAKAVARNNNGKENGVCEKEEEEANAGSKGVGFADAGVEGNVTSMDEKKIIRVQSFVRRWQVTKKYDAEKEEHAKRMQYLHDKFTDEANRKRLIRLQAVVRRVLVERAYQMKINRRNHIAKEILQTEQSYVKGLDTLHTVFQDPLAKEKIIPAESIRTIFGSVGVIHATSRNLLAQLEERMEKWYTEGQRIGDIFLGIVKMLKVYADYVNNYNTAIEEISRLKKENKEFRSFLKNSIKQCGGLDINSYLVLPIQRIPRYVMLLEEMYKYTPDYHKDRKDLGQVWTQEEI